MIRTSIEADLDFSVELPDERVVSGQLSGSGSGSTLELRVDDPSVFAGRRDAHAVRCLADILAGQGIAVTVIVPAGPLVTLGAPHTPWWQRRVTGSRHIRIERAAGLLSLARGRARASAAGALPSSDLVPPTTVWPVLPTLLRRPRQVSTTHDANRGGNPRLVLAPASASRPGDPRREFPLRDGVTTIGGDQGCDVWLPGLDPLHAEVHHDRRDELVLVRRTLDGRTRVNGRDVDEALLRTGTRVEVGGWTMSFFREEYADHGRPHGGRQGGELGHQEPQAPRPGPSPTSAWTAP